MGEGKAVEFGGKGVAASFDGGKQVDIFGRLAGARENAVEIFEHHRQAALRQIAEAVGEFGVDAIDDRFVAVAAVLPEADFAHQEVTQGIDPVARRHVDRID